MDHFLQATFDKMMSDVPTYRMITPSVLSDRLRVSNTNDLYKVAAAVDVFLLAVVSLLMTVFYFGILSSCAPFWFRSMAVWPGGQSGSCMRRVSSERLQGIPSS